MVSFFGFSRKPSVRFNVEGMACSSCAERVETAISTTPGVDSVKVDLAAKQAEVVFSGAPAADAVLAAIKNAGYQATKA